MFDAYDAPMIDAAATQTMHLAMPFTAKLGIEVMASTASSVRSRLAWHESLTTAGGIMHGGALMSFADSVGALVAYASTRSSRVERHLRLASGLLSLGFGLLLVYQIGIVDGLITGYPGATPSQ